MKINMKKQEGHYTIKAVEALPKKGNLNWIYLLPNGETLIWDNIIGTFEPTNISYMSPVVGAQKTEPFLPISDIVVYIDDENVIREVMEYSDGNTSRFVAISDPSRVYQTLTEVPTNWVEFVPLAPTLTNESAFRYDWYQDSGGFMISPRANRDVTEWQIFIENANFGEVTGLTPTTGYTYEFLTNPDGTTTHLFSSSEPVLLNELAIEIVGDTPTPPGENLGSATPIGVTTFSN